MDVYTVITKLQYDAEVHKFERKYSDVLRKKMERKR